MLSSLLPCFQIIATQWTHIYISKIKSGRNFYLFAQLFKTTYVWLWKGDLKFKSQEYRNVTCQALRWRKEVLATIRPTTAILEPWTVRQAKAIKVHAVKIIVISFCNILKIEQSWTESYQSSAGKGFFYAVTMILFQSADLKFKRYW